MTRYILSPFGNPAHSLCLFGLPVASYFSDRLWIIHLPLAQTGGSNSILFAIIGLALGAVAMFVAQRMLGQDARTQSQRMLEQAKLDAENLVKKSELEQKEKLFKLQTQFEQDLKKQRDEIRDRENQLAQREQGAKQAVEDLKKQERFVESNQRKLSEKLDDVTKKSDQYNKLITQAQSDLQRVTGL